MSYLEGYNSTKENFENSTKPENQVSAQNASTVEGMHFDVDLGNPSEVKTLMVELIANNKTAEAGELGNQQRAFEAKAQTAVAEEAKQTQIKEEIEHELV